MKRGEVVGDGDYAVEAAPKQQMMAGGFSAGMGGGASDNRIAGLLQEANDWLRQIAGNTAK